MSSLIPGYNYDIFISYRQKDNKGERWVSEFVDALKTELESTFKEEISVYFDINPHDGLLETHDVDASLQEKLKCLIFIPVISRTYCDPKSFAWEHEFKAFLEQASKDQFGLKVKLPNGNVSNRVLPIRIHDLDIEDIKECESFLGGVLRGIEFIYKSSGVNRPLRANEDHPQDNLSKTYYRDQINKVANAIDELLRSLTDLQDSATMPAVTPTEPQAVIKQEFRKHHDARKSHYKESKEKAFRVKRKYKRKNLLITIGSSLTALIILTLWYFWPFLFSPKITPAVYESSLAVVSFENISNSEGFENFVTGTTRDLVSRISRIQNLKVVEVKESYKNKDLQNSIRAICREFQVKYILQGSVKADSENVTIMAELINGEKEKVLWQESKTSKLDSILAIQDIMIREVVGLINSEYSNYNIQRKLKVRPTRNFKAYELFLRGTALLTSWNYENLKESVDQFGRALKIDDEFVEAYANSALANLLLVYFYGKDEVATEAIKKFAKKALSLESDNEIALMSMEGYYIMKMASGKKVGILEYRDMVSKLKRLMIKNPYSPMGLFGMAEFHRFLHKDLNKTSIYLQMALEQSEKILKGDPSNGLVRGIAAQSAGLIGEIEFKTGHFLEAIKSTEYSIQLVPFIARTYIQLSNFYFDTDQPSKARAVLDQAITNSNSPDDRAYVAMIQGKYSMIDGDFKRAEQYWTKSMDFLGKPEKPYYDYSLLYRNIMLRKLGYSDTADSMLTARLKTRGINPWLEPVMEMFLGYFREADLLKIARRNWQKCEAFFFLGEKNLFTGNLTEAKRYFNESLNTGVTDYLEYDMSESELKRHSQ